MYSTVPAPLWNGKEMREEGGEMREEGGERREEGGEREEGRRHSRTRTRKRKRKEKEKEKEKNLISMVSKYKCALKIICTRTS